MRSLPRKIGSAIARGGKRLGALAARATKMVALAGSLAATTIALLVVLDAMIFGKDDRPA